MKLDFHCIVPQEGALLSSDVERIKENGTVLFYRHYAKLRIMSVNLPQQAI